MKGNRDYASEIICTQDFMKIHFTWNTSKAKNDEDPRDPFLLGTVIKMDLSMARILEKKGDM